MTTEQPPIKDIDPEIIKLLEKLSAKELLQVIDSVMAVNAKKDQNSEIVSFLQEQYAGIENAASLIGEAAEFLQTQELKNVPEIIYNGYEPRVSKHQVRNIEGLIMEANELAKKLEGHCNSLMAELQCFTDPDGIDEEEEF